MSRLFGAVRQNGYVVRDIEAAMKHWVEVLGVGPWFYLEHFPITDFRYRDTPSPVDVSIALANSGTLQIELIEQRNDAPSMFRDFLDAGHEGLQHLAYWPVDFEDVLERALDRGCRIGQSGTSGNMGPFAYLQTEFHPGTVVELSKLTDARRHVFEGVAAAAVNWDGGDPVRTDWSV
jgi:hypothetical protein